METKETAGVAGQVAINGSDERNALLKEQMEWLQSVHPSGRMSFFSAFDAVHQFCAGACGKGASYVGAIESNTPSAALEGRLKLIDEEVNKELVPLLQKIIENGGSSLEQKAELLDHICDSIYVLAGLSVNMGLPIDNAFAVVHGANMSKVFGPLVPNGPVFDENGKVVKPEGWTAPDRQIWELCFALYSARVKKPNNLPEDTAGQEPSLTASPVAVPDSVQEA